MNDRDPAGRWWLAMGDRSRPVHDAWLSPDERVLAGSIRFTKRRDEYLTRRWTAKHAVARILGNDPSPETLAAIEVRNRDSGAPYVVVDGRPIDVEVSLSDRAGWAVCIGARRAAGGEGALGIDLELVEPRTEGFVSDFLTPAEQAYVRSSGVVRDVAANLIWSAKEAALKVLQIGLRVDTRTVEVTLDHPPLADGWAELVVTSRDGGRFPGWWRRDGHFLLTLCSRVQADPPQLLPGGADLSRAEPAHAWVDRPLT